MRYSKKEIEKIFTNTSTKKELEAVCVAFKFLTDSKEQPRSLHLQMVLHLTFRKIYNSDESA